MAEARGFAAPAPAEDPGLAAYVAAVRARVAREKAPDLSVDFSTPQAYRQTVERWTKAAAADVVPWERANQVARAGKHALAVKGEDDHSDKPPREIRFVVVRTREELATVEAEMAASEEPDPDDVPPVEAAH